MCHPERTIRSLSLSEAVYFLDLGARASKTVEHWPARLCGKQRKSTASFRERIKVRVIVSRARGAHVACAIPRAAFGINHVKPLKGFTLPMINRCGLRLLIPKHSRSLSLSRERGG